MGGININDEMWIDILEDCDDNKDGKVIELFINIILFRYQKKNLVIFYLKSLMKIKNSYLKYKKIQENQAKKIAKRAINDQQEN